MRRVEAAERPDVISQLNSTNSALYYYSRQLRKAPPHLEREMHRRMEELHERQTALLRRLDAIDGSLAEPWYAR